MFSHAILAAMLAWLGLALYLSLSDKGDGKRKGLAALLMVGPFAKDSFNRRPTRREFFLLLLFCSLGMALLVLFGWALKH